MKTSTVATITGITLASAVVGYAAYFDYRRRHDANFRRSLGKQYKRQKKAEAKKADDDKKASETAIAAAVASTRAALADGSIPKDPTTRESYFMEQISIGELLFNRGEDFHLDSATAFFRALKVYPQPFELLIILGKTVPPEVNAIIMKMVEADVLLSEGGEGANPLAAAAGAGASASINVNEVDDEAPSSSNTTKEQESKEEKKEEKKEEEPKEAPKTESVSGSTNEWDVVSATSEKPVDEAQIGKGFGAAAQPATDSAPIHFTFGSNDSPAQDEETKEAATKEEKEAPQEAEKISAAAQENATPEEAHAEPEAAAAPAAEESEQKQEAEDSQTEATEPSAEDPEEVAP